MDMYIHTIDFMSTSSGNVPVIFNSIKYSKMTIHLKILFEVFSIRLSPKHNKTN